MLAYAYHQDKLTFAKVLGSIDTESLSQAETQMLQIAKLVLEQDNQALSELLISLLNPKSENTIAWTKDELQSYKPQLILAKTLIVQEDYKLCHHYLNRYKEQVANDYACRLVFAQMDFAKGGYKWCVVHYENLLAIPVELHQTDYIQYLIALCQSGEAKKLAGVDVGVILGDEQLLKSWVELQVKNKEWQKIDEIFAKKLDLQQSMVYEYALTQYRMGRFEGLDKRLPKPVFGYSYEYWRLISEIAMLNENDELQKYCYKGMAAVFPEREPVDFFKSFDK